jgi:flagellar export protein FliJ
MPFRFPLATVLRVRKSLEKREERALQKIQLDMARIARQIDELSAEIAKAHQVREQAMQRPIPASHLQMHSWSSEAALARKKSLLRDLFRLEELRDLQLKAYHAAHRNSETLTDLLHKQRDAYELEQARTQQKQLDDIFIARRQRS